MCREGKQSIPISSGQICQVQFLASDERFFKQPKINDLQLCLFYRAQPGLPFAFRSWSSRSSSPCFN